MCPDTKAEAEASWPQVPYSRSQPLHLSAPAVPTCKVGTEDEMQGRPPPRGGVRPPKKTSATLSRGQMKGAVCVWSHHRRFIEESSQGAQSARQSRILSLFIGET